MGVSNVGTWGMFDVSLVMPAGGLVTDHWIVGLYVGGYDDGLCVSMEQPRFITAARLQSFRHHAALCVPESHLNFPFDIRNVNIVDPITPWNNLGRSVTRKVGPTVALLSRDCSNSVRQAYCL